jgi:hypothetical protein
MGFPGGYVLFLLVSYKIDWLAINERRDIVVHKVILVKHHINNQHEQNECGKYGYLG